MLMFFTRASGLSMILNDETIEFNHKKTIFLLCNEHASRYTVANELDKA